MEQLVGDIWYLAWSLLFLSTEDHPPDRMKSDSYSVANQDYARVLSSGTDDMITEVRDMNIDHYHLHHVHTQRTPPSAFGC